MKRFLILLAFFTLVLLPACISNNISQLLTASISETATSQEVTVSNESHPPTSTLPTGRTLMDLGELPDVTMNTEFTIYPNSVFEIITCWKNESQHSVVYGEYIEIFKKDGGSWAKVEDTSGTPYPSLGFGLDPGEECEQKYYIASRFGSLDTGDYRIYVRVSYSEPSPTFAVFAEFSVS